MFRKIIAVYSENKNNEFLDKIEKTRMILIWTFIFLSQTDNFHITTFALHGSTQTIESIKL
jgi:hypothetical protein